MGLSRSRYSEIFVLMTRVCAATPITGYTDPAGDWESTAKFFGLGEQEIEYGNLGPQCKATFNAPAMQNQSVNAWMDPLMDWCL